MYSVKPIGINIKDNDRDVLDGSLQESINMQWRDGAFKPIPERIISEINASGYSTIILHKVGDENTINVIGFNENASSTFLAFDLSEFLGGNAIGGNILEWFGAITNGVYQTRPITQFPFVATPGMSFTILNGLVYFMGDGSTPEEQYYFKLEFNEATETYSIYDMYAWKTLIPFYPYQNTLYLTAPKNTYQAFSQCGTILIRFALALKTGEVVLHSPIYGFLLYGLNCSNELIKRGDLIENIHAIINMDLSFADMNLFEQEISAINIYASTPYYQTKFTKDCVGNYSAVTVAKDSDIKGNINQKAEDNFYLIKTINAPIVNEKLLLTVGGFDTDITLPVIAPFLETVYTKINLDTIAAGEIMPVDNFSYHKLYGKITSYNGRLVIKRPVTVLSSGHMRALATMTGNANEAFSMVTEDGKLDGVSYAIDKSVLFGSSTATLTRGLLSYPDGRASLVGSNSSVSPAIRMFKLRKNNSHNMACCFDISKASYDNLFSIQQNTPDTSLLKISTNYTVFVQYEGFASEIQPTTNDANVKYSSENRIQFSQAGEFKVWPALNSYRIGEGKVMNLGSGSVNPSESQVISPIIVGTTDGVYTINLDPSGTNFIASITKTANLPFLSEEILEIDQNILFVSDKGLMVFSDGNINNLTEAFFPQQGNGSFPTQEAIYPNYDVLTQAFFGVNGNPYEFDDVVKYLKGALFAFDARRNNVWCSNPAYRFSLVYNLDISQWGMSTMVFDRKFELYSIINTEQEGELYTRYMVKAIGVNNLLILSGEDLTKEVFYHILTRPIKFQSVDDYKVLARMFYRTMLQRKANATAGYFSIGLWGQQDVDRFKKSIPIVSKSDNRTGVYPGNIRYHIPIDCRKGKYKSITALQSGKTLPESYISSFDFDIYSVDNTKMR